MEEKILNLIELRISQGLRFQEWKDGALHGSAASASLPGHCTEPHGRYLIARAPTVPTFWAAFRTALATGVPLVLLPPSSDLEEKILLRQLPATSPPSAVLVLFTSGSTGEPKAVFHSEASLLASAHQLHAAFPGNAPTACLLPPWGMAGVAFHFLLPLLRGGDILFSRESFLSWSSNASRLFHELDVGLLALNPFLLEMLLRSGVEPAWKGQVVSLTAPLKRALMASFALACGRRPLEIYGMTEAAGPIFLEGKSLGINARISERYELELRGPQLCLGYSASGVFEDRAASAWFKTGDIFTVESDAFLHQARERDLIDTGGRKLGPRLIEEAFELIPELSECLVFPVELAGVERPGLIYVRGEDCSLKPEELALLVEKHAQKTLSADLRPRWWKEVSSIPRLGNGKPDRKTAKTRWAYREKALWESTSIS